MRYPCEAVLVGKTYAKFHLDVGCGDAIVGEPERLTGDDLLSFAGIPPAAVIAISKPQQFAEKIHAYTFPWTGRHNTRSKDLVDLILLIERGLPEVSEIRSAIRTTFATRGTHPIPETLQPPPGAWAVDFPPMAIEAGLSTTDYLAPSPSSRHSGPPMGSGRRHDRDRSHISPSRTGLTSGLSLNHIQPKG